MGLTISWAIRCDDHNCVNKVIEETAKFSEKHGLTHQLISPSRVISCTGKHSDSDAGVCFEFNFEPWEKALKQSYVMRKEKYQVFGCGNPMFRGEGVFGHNLPEKMLKLIDKGCPYKSIDAEPTLGEGGYQTGDFVKTQYNGIEHHIVGCRILDNIGKHADKMLVNDDGHFCGEGDKHDMKDLMDNFEEYTNLSASIGRQLRERGWKDDQLMGGGEETYQRLKSGK
jgi:hypothetical protein